MRQLAGVIKLHLRNRLTWLYIPGLVLFSSFAMTLFISLLIGVSRDSYSGAIASIYIYMIVIGITTPRDTFSFALGLSVRRRDYFTGTVVASTIVNVAWAMVLSLFAFIESKFGSGWGIKLHFFYLPYVNNGPFLGQFWIDLVVLIHMFFLGFAIGSIYQRFGRIGMYLFIIIILLALSIGSYLLTYFRGWEGFFGPLFQHSAVELASWAVPLIICYALIAYLLLRRASA